MSMPAKEKAKQTLTPLELEIMQVLWENGASIVTEVIPKLKAELAYTTAKINSPEFKQQMGNLQKQMESDAMRRSMEEASKQLKAAQDQMREAPTK